MRCSVEQCPFSIFKCEGASWEKEVSEPDWRLPLVDNIKRRIKNQFGFIGRDVHSHAGDTILIFPKRKKDIVEVYLPESVLNDLLYNPGKYDISELANSLEIELGIPWHYDNDGNFVPSKHENVPEDADKLFCYNYWRQYSRFQWFE